MDQRHLLFSFFLVVAILCSVLSCSQHAGSANPTLKQDVAVAELSAIKPAPAPVTYSFTIEQIEQMEKLKQALSALRAEYKTLKIQKFADRISELEEGFTKLGYFHGHFELYSFAMTAMIDIEQSGRALAYIDKLQETCLKLDDRSNLGILLFNAAVLHERLNEKERALLFYNRCLQEGHPRDHHTRAAAYLNAGTIFHKDNKLDEADQNYRLALAENPSDRRLVRSILLNTLKVQHARHQIEPALSSAKHILALEPSDEQRYEVLMVLAMIAENHEALDEAIGHADKALAIAKDEDKRKSTDNYRKYLRKKKEYLQSGERVR